MRFRKLGSVLVVVFVLLVFALLPQPTHATTYTQTRYLDTALYSTNNLFLYPLLSITQDIYGSGSYDYFTANSTLTGSRTTIWYFQAYITNWDGSNVTELTATAITIGSRTTNGEGIQRKTWNCPGSYIKRNDTIYIEIRYSIVGGPLNQQYETSVINGIGFSTWVSESQGATQLLNSTWTISLYTYRYYSGVPTDKTISRIYFNNATYDSKIENIQYDDGVTPPTEENITAMAPFFILGLIMAIPIGLLLGKKT